MGHLASIADPSGSETYTYDKAGRLIKVAKVVGTTTYNTTYAYNTVGRLTQITYPSGRVVQYSYDNAGRLCAVATTTSDCSSYSNVFLTIPTLQYDASGRPLNWTYGNGVTASATYSSTSGTVSSLSHAKGAATLFGQSYYYQQDLANCTNGNALGSNGQIQCIADPVQPGRSSIYTYDQLGRLSRANTAGSTAFPAWGLSETYDRYGNRTAQTVTAGNSGFNVSLNVNATNNQITGLHIRCERQHNGLSLQCRHLDL